MRLGVSPALLIAINTDFTGVAQCEDPVPDTEQNYELRSVTHWKRKQAEYQFRKRSHCWLSHPNVWSP